MGEAYVSRFMGCHVEAQVMGPPCADSCYGRITSPIATVNHKEFWAISDIALQNTYIESVQIRK